MLLVLKPSYLNLHIILFSVIPPPLTALLMIQFTPWSTEVTSVHAVRAQIITTYARS